MTDCLGILKVLDPTVKSTHIVYPFIQKVIKLGIDNPEVRDEILLQLCKQVTLPMDDIPNG
jgi:hypothetical protein